WRQRWLFDWRPDDRRDESIAAPRHRLNEARVLGWIAQRVAQFLDGAVQTSVEVDERVRGPEALPQLVARDEVAGPFEQQQQDLNGLLGEPDLQPLLAQLTRSEVQLE